MKPISRGKGLRVNHLSGIPCSFLIIVLSKIGQPDYLHVNNCSNVQKRKRNKYRLKNGILSDQFQ